MHPPFPSLFEKFQKVLARPEVGASAVFSSLYTKPAKLVPLNIVFKGASWLLIAAVLPMMLLSYQTSAFPIVPVVSLLTAYLLYVVGLEFAARRFNREYERTWFRACRVVANYVFITSLLWLYPAVGRYFWFFYTLPILQSIVYFRERVITLVTLASIATYCLVGLMSTRTATPPTLDYAPEYALMGMNSLILVMLAFVFYWLFKSAWTRKAENVDLTEKTQKSLILLATLNQINLHVNSARTIDEILQIALPQGLNAIRTNEGSILLLNPHTNQLEFRAWIVQGSFIQGKNHRTLNKAEGIAGYVMQSGKSYNCADTSQDHQYITSFTGRIPRSLLCVPIVANGPVLGVINVDSPAINFFQPEDVEFLLALAGNLAIALEKARLYEHSQWMTAMLLELHKATTAMQSEMQLATLLNEISERATKLLNADSGGILLLDETDNCLRFRGSYGLSEKATNETCDRVGMSIAGRVVAQKQAIIAHNIPRHLWFHNPAAADEGFLAIVSTPMWINGKVIGTLDLHSKSQANAFTEDDLTILSLMAQHAAAAIEKAQKFALEQRRNQAYGLVRRVLETVDRHPQTNRVDALLFAIERELKQQMIVTRYSVVLKNEQGNWLYNYFYRDHADAYIPRWQRPLQHSLLAHLTGHKTALFLPTEVAHYCQQHGLQLEDNHGTWSWIGVPMIVGDLTVGAMSISLDAQQKSKDAYQTIDGEFFQIIVQQLSGIVYAAWVDEQRSELYQKLTTLQSAGETIMLLAEKNEDWLWHATLTLATAHYGLRFERALFFLVERDHQRLRGRMGIGHFEQALAARDWRKDEEGGMTFERYLALLRAGELSPTPIETFIRNWQIDLPQAYNAFSTVLQRGEIVIVPAQEANERLLAPFVNQFGVCDYALVPVKAGNRVLGLVVLSNPFKGEPQNEETLVYFQTLTNQAALIYEDLRHRNRLAQFIAINHKVLVTANNQPLGATLAEICQAAKELTGADLIALYPLLPDHSPARYDLDNARYATDDPSIPVTENHYPSSYTRYIMETGTVWIDDIEQAGTSLGGVHVADHKFIQTHDIRALIAVPIRGPVTHKLRGVLYLNFCTAQHFTEQEIHLAESFAQLANLTIRHHHQFATINSENAAKEEELQVLGEVLQKALVYGVDERIFVQMILSSTRKLFRTRDIRCSLALITRSGDLDQAHKARRFNHSYYLAANGEFYDKNEAISPNDSLAQPLGSLGLPTGSSGRNLSGFENLTGPPVANLQTDSEQPEVATIDIEVPVITPSARSIGVLTIGSTQFDVVTDKHKAILGRLASVIGLGLDNLHRQQNLHIILEAAVAMTASTTLEATLDAVVMAARRVAPNLSVLTIWHKSPLTNELVLGKSYGAEQETILRCQPPSEDGLVCDVMAARKPIWAEDITNRTIFTRSKFVVRERIKSSVAFPLRAQDEPVGVMFFNYRQPHKFTGEEHALFPILAQIAAACINEALLLEKANKERKRLEANVEIVNTIGGNADVEETLQRILRSLTELLPGVSPCILLYDESSQTLAFAPAVREFCQVDNPMNAKMDRLALNPDSTVGALALLSKQRSQKLMLNVHNVHQPTFKLRTKPAESGSDFPADLQPSDCRVCQQTQSQFIITLYSQQRKRLLGVLVLESPNLNNFDLDAELTIWVIAKQIRFMLERHLAAAEMRFMDTVAGATAWAADIAHDINRQTGLIRNRVGWLNREFYGSPQAHQYLAEIDQSAQQLAGVMASSTHDNPAELIMIDIHQQLREWVTELVERRGADTQVWYDFPMPALFLKARPLTLRRVIRHLVRNALESMGWTPDQHLTIRTQVVTPECLEIQIEDSGAGITDLKIRQTIFNEPISSKGAGHGYGLLFVRGALERMGGAVQLLPYTTGRGAIFAITLPML